MINPEISIIVPIYNAEDYLPRCIDSILEQTFTNFELIMVNDGSTDQSGEICDQYALKDNRIKVIHIENGGVSNARNTGMKLAQSKYLMFCDSDDYVERDWCRNLYDAAVENNNSLPVSGVRIVYNIGETQKEEIRQFNNWEIIDKKKYFETYKKGLSGSLCCKIYRRKVIDRNSLCFDVNWSRGEDLLFNLSYMKHMDSFLTLPYLGYNYVHGNEESLMNSYIKDLYPHIANRYDAWLEYFYQNKVDKKEIKEFASYYYLNYLNVLKNTLDERNQDNLIKKLKYNNRILNSKEFLECLELADLSKEDPRYIRLLKTRNYYLVWLAEQAYKIKSHFK